MTTQEARLVLSKWRLGLPLPDGLSGQDVKKLLAEHEEECKVIYRLAELSIQLQQYAHEAKTGKREARS